MDKKLDLSIHCLPCLPFARQLEGGRPTALLPATAAEAAPAKGAAS